MQLLYLLYIMNIDFGYHSIGSSSLRAYPSTGNSPCPKTQAHDKARHCRSSSNRFGCRPGLPAAAAACVCSEKGVRRPKRCRLAHAFLWGYSYQRLKLAQLLGQLGAFLTCAAATSTAATCGPPTRFSAACYFSGRQGAASRGRQRSLGGHL